MNSMNKRTAGAWGEDLVVRVLRQRGHEILARNVRTRWAEIDIVSRHAQVIWVIEVKTRSSEAFGAPEQAVDWRKQHKIAKLGSALVRRWAMPDTPILFVVAGVLTSPTPRVRFINTSAC